MTHGAAGAQPPTNFISDLFFLINAIQHFGVVKTIGSRIRAEKNISEVEKELKHTEASRGEWEGVSKTSDFVSDDKSECQPICARGSCN